MTRGFSNHATPRTSNLQRLAARLTLVAGLSLTAIFAVAQPASAAVHSVALGCVPTVRAVGRVNVRLGPGVQFNPPLGTLFTGNQAQVTGRLRNNAWYRIAFNNGEGWVSRVLVRATCLGNAPVVPPLPVSPANKPLFRADANVVAPGQCTTLRWNVNDVAAVFLITNGAVQGVGGNDARQVCPASTTTYVLRVQRRDGSVFDTPLTVVVTAATPIPQANFRADNTTISPGQCTTLRWNIDNVRGVFLWTGNSSQGVGGNDSRQVCPQATTKYRLQVLLREGGAFDSFVTVAVSGAPPPGINFSVDNGNLTRGQCTSLRWQVNGSFRVVFLLDSSANTTTEVGPSAAIGVCPQVNATYTLRVIGNDSRQFDQSITVNVAQGPTPVPQPTPQP